MTSGFWPFVLVTIIGASLLGVARSGILRFKRVVPFEKIDNYEIIRDAVADEPNFAESLKALIRTCPSVARVYLFVANVGQTTNALSVGLVFSGDFQPEVIRQIDRLWIEETRGNKLLGITSLTPELERIASRVCSPLFYR